MTCKYSRLPPNRYPIYPILPQIRCDFGFPGLVCGKIKNIPDTRYPIPVSRKKPIGITILGNIVLCNRDCWACLNMKPMFFSLQNPISTTFRQLPDALFTCIITINLTTYFPEFLVPASQFKRATFTGNTMGLTKLSSPDPQSMLAFHSTSVAS